MCVAHAFIHIPTRPCPLAYALVQALFLHHPLSMAMHPPQCPHQALCHHMHSLVHTMCCVHGPSMTAHPLPHSCQAFPPCGLCMLSSTCMPCPHLCHPLSPHTPCLACALAPHVHPHVFPHVHAHIPCISLSPFASPNASIPALPWSHVSHALPDLPQSLPINHSPKSLMS